MTTSTIFLSSCAPIEIPTLEKPIERCALFLEEIEESIYKGKCRCHDYEISRDHIGRVTESIDMPLSYCNKFVALRPSTSWAELRTWFEALFFWENQTNKSIKKLRKKYKIKKKR